MKKSTRKSKFIKQWQGRKSKIAKFFHMQQSIEQYQLRHSAYE